MVWALEISTIPVAWMGMLLSGAAGKTLLSLELLVVLAQCFNQKPWSILGGLRQRQH